MYYYSHAPTPSLVLVLLRTCSAHLSQPNALSLSSLCSAVCLSVSLLPLPASAPPSAHHCCWPLLRRSLFVFVARARLVFDLPTPHAHAHTQHTHSTQDRGRRERADASRAAHTKQHRTHAPHSPAHLPLAFDVQGLVEIDLLKLFMKLLRLLVDSAGASTRARARSARTVVPLLLPLPLMLLR